MLVRPTFQGIAPLLGAGRGLKLALGDAGYFLFPIAPLLGAGRGLKQEGADPAPSRAGSPRSSERGAD